MSLIKTAIAFGMGYYIGSHYHPFMKQLFHENLQSTESVITVTKTDIKVFGKSFIKFSQKE